MKKLVMMICAASLLMAACKKDTKEIGVPASKMEGITSNWQLLKANQVDELSLTKEAVNIYGYFSTSVKLPNILFTDSTYSVDTTGLSYNFFGGAEGKWKFDDPEFPSTITFTPNGGNAFSLKLNGPIRPQDNLKLTKEVHKTCKGKATWVMSYNLEFTRK
jgi:hypothetical protein